MIQPLRAWLNGTRDYYTGLAIYAQLSPDENLLNVLRKGPNDFRTKHLLEVLLEAYHHLKNSKPAEKIAQNANLIARNADLIAPNTNKTTPDAKTTNSLGTKTKGAEAGPIKNADQRATEIQPANPDLYNACKLEADHKYKEVMNKRAVLFKMVNVEGFEDPNVPAKIHARAQLAIEVVQGWQTVSQLYDRANYVKLHGRLPDGGEDINEPEYDHLPDHLVKLRLDNARKAYNKLKKKEATPERVALMQKHEENISKLEKQWRSLRP